ncbi:UDP-glucuronic acid decarboxylase 5 [Populus alba x Populus x berolinensis]|nr:UDP-glucuronic acid decarboxylase 5 [Populus alba x Populus x berolinensis]
MASNGDHQTTVKPPPSPSPLRNSKFSQSNMRILVTGGAGFIGSHLVDKLMENEKNEVIVADNYFTGSKDNLRKWIGQPRFELIRHDVTEPLLVEVDQIYHLACPASPIFYKYNPVKTIKTNVIGTLNMLGLAKRVGARILLTSTSEVYGDPLVHPQPESYWGNVNPIGVRSCYDEGKRVAETLMFDYHRQHGIEIRIARIFNTYGPRMNIDDGRVVSNFIAQALRGEPLTVQKPGTQTRSFCYVSDMVCRTHTHTHTHVYMHVYQLQPRVISNGVPRVSNARLKCIRLMALFASWKERTLDQSTLETQACLCLHRKAWNFMYVFLAINLVVLSVHFQGNLP